MAFLRINILVWLGLALVACGTLERRRGPTQPSDRGFEEIPEQKEPPREVPMTPVLPKKVGIILGPGGAKALAHAGVLKELQKARIPIQNVIGLEWGALIGGLFAQRGQAHEMEWKLIKLERQSLPTK